MHPDEAQATRTKPLEVPMTQTILADQPDGEAQVPGRGTMHAAGPASEEARVGAEAHRPRTIAVLADQGARRMTCGFCWQAPGEPCTAGGYHLARFLRAFQHGLISRAELVGVLATLTVISEASVVTEVTP